MPFDNDYYKLLPYSDCASKQVIFLQPTELLTTFENL